MKDRISIPPEYWLDHAALKEVEDLFLIGWKGSEDLFNRRLVQQANKLRRIVIVNPDVEGVKQCLSKYMDLSIYSIEHVKYFDDFVLNHLQHYG